MQKLIISGDSYTFQSKLNVKDLEELLQERLNKVVQDVIGSQVPGVIVSAFDIAEAPDEKAKITTIGTYLYSDEWEWVCKDSNKELSDEEFDNIKKGVITNIKVTYPDPGKYGFPDAVCIDGALEFLSRYGFTKIAIDVDIDAECLYDDGAPYMEVTVVL